MTTATEIDEVEEIDLNRHYTEEERDAMFDAYIKACESGKDEEANEILSHMPLHPRWAKIVAEVYGKNYLREHFNITHANEVYGEGWLDEIKESRWVRRTRQ